jgi:hypothetical protein
VEDFNYFEDGVEGTPIDGGFQTSDATPNTYQDEWDFSADEIVALDHGQLVETIAADSVVGLNLPLVYDDGFEFIDQGEYYNEPFVPSDEWSAPVQPNAPPNMFDEAFDFFAVDAAEHDDIFLIVDDDDDAVGPNFVAPVSQFTDDAWLWDEDPQPLSIAVDYQQADAAIAPDSGSECPWDWFAEQIDDDLQFIIDDDDDGVGANGVAASTTPIYDDAAALEDCDLEEFFADHFGNEDGDPAAIDDSFEWDEAPEDDSWWTAADSVVGASVAALPSIIEDGYPHFEDQADDDWHVTGDDDDDAVGPDLVVPASQMFDEPWSWDEGSDDDWQTLTDDDDDAISTDGAPNPVDDAWTWSDELDEISIEDGNAFVDLAQAPAQVFDEPWIWDDENSDEPAIDQQIGANLIVPPSQFTDDAWDWTEWLEVEDQIDQDLEWALLPLLVASHWVVRRRRRRLFTISRRKQRAFEVSAVSSKRFDEKDPTEKVPLTFDFTVDLPDGVVLTSIQGVTFTTVYGTDASPNALANGLVGLDATSKKVIVPVQGGLDGRDYNVSVVALTSESDLVLELNGVLPVRS